MTKVNMYRNKEELPDKTYRETHIELETHENAIREIQNLISRFDQKLKSISEGPNTQTEANISLINGAKNHRLLMKATLDELQQIDDGEWEHMREKTQKSFTEAKEAAAKY